VSAHIYFTLLQNLVQFMQIFSKEKEYILILKKKKLAFYMIPKYMPSKSSFLYQTKKNSWKRKILPNSQSQEIQFLLFRLEIRSQEAIILSNGRSHIIQHFLILNLGNSFFFSNIIQYIYIFWQPIFFYKISAFFV
jgi:hypothetical protein